MKERVVSALIGLVVLAAALFFYNTLIFNAVMGLIALVAVFELLNATDTLQFKAFSIIGIVFSLFLPFVQHPKIRPFAPLGVFLVLVYFFALVLKHYNKVRFEQACTILLISLVVPLFFSSAVYIRDSKGTVLGMYYLLLALGSAWLSDSGAYFTGYLLGKHKMAPNVSPKKTVEGAVGGIITAIILNIGVGFLYTKGAQALGNTIQINYWLVLVLSPFLAGLAMLGDLVASVIKRQHNVKDYGHIMPGHGGVMDRFDSVLLTLPAVYIIVLYLPVAV